ncbi:16S rRNA (cytosine(967)-C(5))-methyltransferase RsmB [Acinetobacter rathckeae]|uniref:16S rRNA (cytosine(967)-C(5))-methyltransferase RsmB n=1 Tax=Acinetobacter rathckeae TaxID=2605272 RepID=UPI0018A314B8|nr:16S rRNA (cytosine(967)-C(5))-methyltransferase RsmB [Acinetobacter rathckeae]MBF7689142.1 16S rRNA (cytosine(967)-C(5))-methyltransferase RsmB [Acinetobacter rathckeae]MBF7696729.1 16S rRNA (cytosine(967)-C(5))-methyltransferase RsmB [Acinetobacter rathckeae]
MSQNKYSPSMQHAPNLRAKIIVLLSKIQEGESLSTQLDQHISQIPERDKALFHELTLGTLRQWYALKTACLPLIKKPIDNNMLHAALYLGLYQLIYTRIPAHAAISETVNAIKQLQLGQFSALVNAILRQYTRSPEELAHTVQHAHALPSWLYKRLKNNWPEHLEELTKQLKCSSPITLRVNPRKITRSDYFDQLQQKGIKASYGKYSEQAIYLNEAVSIQSLPGFHQGFFSVQDEHAQLCGQIIPDINAKIVIDACAAPGGKTTHLLERFTPKKLIAIDNSSKRLLRVTENLQRLQLTNQHCEMICDDAITWKNDRNADLIILDAPCSATGVIRKHPDIKLLRKSSDIEQTTHLQQSILENLWPQVKVGGHLLYITCSILKAENVEQMSSFFERNKNAQEEQLNVTWGIKQAYGRQLLPIQETGDGFYYCLIRKVA